MPRLGGRSAGQLRQNSLPASDLSGLRNNIIYFSYLVGDHVLFQVSTGKKQ
jgi:hypothetical protein